MHVGVRRLQRAVIANNVWHVQVLSGLLLNWASMYHSLATFILPVYAMHSLFTGAGAQHRSRSSLRLCAHKFIIPNSVAAGVCGNSMLPQVFAMHFVWASINRGCCLFLYLSHLTRKLTWFCSCYILGAELHPAARHRL